MAVKARRVAVIGTGPAGAIATDALIKEQAFDTIRVFERQAGVGGTWYVLGCIALAETNALMTVCEGFQVLIYRQRFHRLVTWLLGRWTTQCPSRDSFQLSPN